MKATVRALSALAILLVPSAVTAQGRWNSVPAFPTGCYTNGDRFLAEVENVIATNTAAATRQRASNQTIRDRAEAMSDAAKQGAMMRYLTANPANAARYMEQMTTAGAAQAQKEAELVASRDLLDGKWKAVVAQYEAERAPVDSQYISALHEYEPGGNAARARAMMVAFNTAYENFCRKWFLSSASPFLSHLVELKQHMVQIALPFDAENSRIEELQFTIWGVPTSGYGSTEEYTAINNYLGVVRDIFGRRRSEPARTP